MDYDIRMLGHVSTATLLPTAILLSVLTSSSTLGSGRVYFIRAAPLVAPSKEVQQEKGREDPQLVVWAASHIFLTHSCILLSLCVRMLFIR